MENAKLCLRRRLKSWARRPPRSAALKKRVIRFGLGACGIVFSTEWTNFGFFIFTSVINMTIGLFFFLPSFHWLFLCFRVCEWVWVSLSAVFKSAYFGLSCRSTMAMIPRAQSLGVCEGVREQRLRCTNESFSGFKVLALSRLFESSSSSHTTRPW